MTIRRELGSLALLGLACLAVSVTLSAVLPLASVGWMGGHAFLMFASLTIAERIAR